MENYFKAKIVKVINLTLDWLLQIKYLTIVDTYKRINGGVAFS